MGIQRTREEPYSILMQTRRLSPAKVLSDAGITSVIWAEDALAFVHHVPTCLFNLQLLVADEDLERARDIILSTDCFEFVPTNPPTGKTSFDDPKLLLAYPNAVHLDRKDRKASFSDVQNTNGFSNFWATNLTHIVLHRASYWEFNIHDSKKTFNGVLPPTSFGNVRFPTVAAMLDSLAAMYLTPPDGAFNKSRISQICNFLAYIMLYTLSENGVDPNEGTIIVDGEPTNELHPIHEKILEEVDPANRLFIERQCRGLPLNDGGESKRKRLEILEERENALTST